MPIGDDPAGPTVEGWTLLSALVTQTERSRLGPLVTSNRFPPPAVLAKIAATVDVVPGGRLDLGIGARSPPGHPSPAPVRGAWPAFLRRRVRGGEPRRGVHGHPAAVDRGRAVRLSGTHVDLTGRSATPSRSSVLTHRSSSAGARPRGCAWSSSTPTWGTAPAATSTKPSAAAPPWIAFAEIGRHPDFITRSIVLPVAYGRPGDTRDAVGTVTEARFEHVVLGLPAPPLARWVTAALITTCWDTLPRP